MSAFPSIGRELPILPGLTPEEIRLIVPGGTIFLGYRGSIAHGMYVPQHEADSIDDRDLMSVFVGPVEHYFGFGRPDTRESWVREYDIVAYELRKLFGLLLKGNPNVLSLLWLPDSSALYKTPEWQRVVEHRTLFVSRVAYESFTGYARSQLHKMTHPAFEGYLGAKRRTLFERHGYDTKNAAHLVRLLRMGTEYLREGRLYVDREDAAELLSIKRGEWSLAQVETEAARLFARAEEAHATTTLPAKPDAEAAERLLVDIVSRHHERG